MNTPPSLQLSFNVMDANYNYRLLMRGSNSRDVVQLLKEMGKYSVPGMEELSHKMTVSPDKYRKLFYLLDPYHEQ